MVDLLADRIVVLHNGRAGRGGHRRAQVLGDRSDPYTQRLLASLPVPDPIEQAARRAVWQATREG